MAPPRSIPWRLLLLGTGLVGLCTWGLVQAPPTRLVGSARVYAGTILHAQLAGETTTWDMDLRLDPAIRPPGPAWSLHEGRRLGDGYQLHWLPDRNILHVHRAGAHPALLGSLRLLRPPIKVTFRRRGAELTVLVDDRAALRCLDPASPPVLDAATDQAWGCQCTTGGDLRESILTVQNAPLAGPRWGSDGNPGTDDDERLRTRPDHTLLRVRAALEAVADNLPAAPQRLGLARAALGAATIDQAPLRGNPPHVPDIAGIPEALRCRATSTDDRQRLTQWLALARVQWWLAQDDADDSRLEQAREALGDLMNLGQRTGNPEYPGMLLGLVPRLSAAAARIQARAEDPRRVVDRRRRWLDLLASVTDEALTTAGPNLGDDDRHLLALVEHACAVLGGGATGTPLPLPLDAPPWLAVRWRWLAGDPPRATVLPPLPEGSSGLAPAVDQLVGSTLDLARAAATAECLASLARRDAALTKGSEGHAKARAEEDHAARIGDDPQLSLRDRAIGSVLVALAIGASRPAFLQAARDALVPPATLRARLADGPRASDQAVPPALAEQDPLAWACLRVLLHRHPDIAGSEAARRVLLDVRRPDEYATLLSGQASALNAIWLVRLPPAEALAAALAAQEGTAGETADGALPDWSLLDDVPSLGLPLRLLKPRDDQAPGPLETP